MPTESTCPPAIADLIYSHALAQGGHFDGKKWLGVECPKPHHIDKAGLHAWLAPEHNFIKCHGKHGDIHWRDICAAWGITIPEGDYTPRQRTPDRPLISREVASHELPYHNPRWLDWLQAAPHALDYMTTRGINAAGCFAFGFGYTGRDEQLPTWAWDRLAIPWTRDGQIVAVKLRCIGKPAKGALTYVSLPNSDFSGWYNLVDNPDCPYRIAMEAELDAARFSCDVAYEGAAIASPAGSVGSALKVLPLMDKPLFAMGDDDEAGRKFNASLMKYRPDTIPLSQPRGYKDWGAFIYDLNAHELPDWLLANERYVFHPNMRIDEAYK